MAPPVGERLLQRLGVPLRDLLLERARTGHRQHEQGDRDEDAELGDAEAEPEEGDGDEAGGDDARQRVTSSLSPTKPSSAGSSVTDAAIVMRTVVEAPSTARSRTAAASAACRAAR